MRHIIKIILIVFFLLSAGFCQWFSSDDTVRIVFGGDVMLARWVGKVIEHEGANYPWLGVADVLRDADLAVVNLECVVGTQSRCIRKKYVFQAEPSVLDGLKFAGIDAVSLANNHIYDFFGAGVCESVDSLRSAGIVPIGAGSNIDEFSAPRSFWIRGHWVVIIGLNDTESGFWGGDKPGCMPTWQAWAESLAIEQISQMSSLGATVIVFEHWGWEYDIFPRVRQSELGHKFIDAGATVVIGSHPHRLQGVEFYRGGIIAYSLGNLIFDQRDTLGNIGCLLQIDFTDGTPITVKMLPTETLICFAQPHPIPAELAFEMVKNLCEPLGTDVVCENKWLILSPIE